MITITAEEIFNSIARSFPEFSITEEEVYSYISRASYIAKKIVILDNVEAISEATLQKIGEVNKILPNWIRSVSMGLCEIILTDRNQVSVRIYKDANIYYPRGTDYESVPLAPFEDFNHITRDEFYKAAKTKVLSFNIGENGEAWMYNIRRYDSRKPQVRYWPMTLTDIAKSYVGDRTDDRYSEFIRSILKAVLNAWAEASFIWKDILKDLEEGTSYASIPVKEIFQCHTKKELIDKHYGSLKNRTNKDTIGQSIFYERCKMIVNENEIQKLYGFNPAGYKLSNRKADLIEPLAEFIYSEMMRTNGTDTFKRQGQDIRVRRYLIEDAIRMSIQLKEKVPLSLKSPRSIMEWHDSLYVRVRNKNVPNVRMPKDSKFHKLKMPENCVRLTTKKAFLEEGNFQKNCVATYIGSVNKDRCSIWSMRNEDGSRYTIEIRVVDNKFQIWQMLGYGNSRCDDASYEKVRKCIEKQVPYRNPKK